MCGIYCTNKIESREEVREKLKMIEFRGPDNLGIKFVDNLVFGHLRLSILDLEERANQPMTRAGLTIVYNGEIYNFKDIKKELITCGYHFTTTSDTEVILYGYKQWGEKVLQRMNGMFAFAIYDSDSNKIFCARDRLGVKPFYYFWKNGIFEICSQIRPLMSSDSQVWEESVSIYLDCGYIPSPYSIIKDIYKLSPGNFMEIDLKTKTKKLEIYWDLKEPGVSDLSYEEAKLELHELLKDAVSIRMQADVPLGTFLSGGIDSALVTAIASRMSNNPINTFTIGFDNPNFNESEIARDYAILLNTNHTELTCSTDMLKELVSKSIEVYDEPFADSSALPTLLLSANVKKYVTVALSGDGGDESFLGYVYLDKIKTFTEISPLPYFIRKRVANSRFLRFLGRNQDGLSRLLKTKNSRDYIENFFIGFDSLQINRDTNWLNKYRDYDVWSKEDLQKAADLNIKLWLENDNNVKVDRASMGYSLEVRSPFLDYRIIEFARSLPISYRYKRGLKKRILKDILEEYIPKEKFEHPKKGFSIPLADWIRSEFKNDIIMSLNDDFYKLVPNLNINKFKSQLDQHMKDQRDFSFNIWKIYVLSKWFKEYLS